MHVGGQTRKIDLYVCVTWKFLCTIVRQDCTYIHVHIYISLIHRIHIYTHISIHAHTYAHTHGGLDGARSCVCVCVHMCVCVCVCVCVFVCRYAFDTHNFVQRRIHIYTHSHRHMSIPHIYKRTHAYEHTYIQTHTCIWTHIYLYIYLYTCRAWQCKHVCARCASISHEYTRTHISMCI